MITIRYFAGIREQLACSEESLALEKDVSTVADVIEQLIDVHGDRWQKVLQENRVLVAVNQSMSDAAASINDGDEVAFFPPVTGG